MHDGPSDSVMSASPIGGKPFHVAIIMDGNGRWAKARGQMRTLGHHAGVTALKRTITSAGDLGITHMTVFAFSTENWRRPEQEINDLMGLLRAFIKSDLARLKREGVRVRILGQTEGLPDDVVKMIAYAHDETRDNSRFFLQVALNYGARMDITAAVRKLATQVRAGDIDPQDITEDKLEGALSTAGLPPLDLLIRTSGEHRLSNFLLWEAAYAEFVFQDILWPDYGPEALKAALDIYVRRERRFGAVDPAVSA